MNKLIVSLALLTTFSISNSSLYARGDFQRGDFGGGQHSEQARHLEEQRPGGYGDQYHGNVNPAHAYDRGYQQGANQGAVEGAAVDQGSDVIVVPQSEPAQSSQGGQQ